MLTINVETERRVLDDLSIKNDDEVVPFPLLYEVREPHSDPVLPREIWLPVGTCPGQGGFLDWDNEGFVPSGQADGQTLDMILWCAQFDCPSQGQQPNRVGICPGVTELVDAEPGGVRQA